MNNDVEIGSGSEKTLIDASRISAVHMTDNSGQYYHYPNGIEYDLCLIIDGKKCWFTYSSRAIRDMDYDKIKEKREKLK